MSPIQKPHHHAPFGKRNAAGFRDSTVRGVAPRSDSIMTHWIDHLGVIRPKIGHRYSLNFNQPDHVALRAFIMHRDGYACVWCGAHADYIPSNYDGKKALRTDAGHYLVIDHKLTRRAGGSNDPENLQCLCLPCNSSKISLDIAQFKATVRLAVRA